MYQKNKHLKKKNKRHRVKIETNGQSFVLIYGVSANMVRGLICPKEFQGSCVGIL